MKETATFFTVFLLCMAVSLAGKIAESRPQNLDSKEIHLRALIESNQTDDVAQLIADGVNVNFKYDDGSYPMFVAVNAGNKEIIESLANSGAEVITKDSNEQTPLHLGVLGGDLEIVRLLIENGAEINAKDSSNRTALHLASLKARPDIINTLLENGATVKNNPALLHWAVKGGDLDVIRLLIEKGANVNDNQALLHYAVSEGRPEIVKLLIEKGANPNVKCRNQMTPLIVAVMKGDLDMVKVILDHGVEKIDDTDKDGNTALLYASSSGNKEMSKLLIKNGANIFATGWGQFVFYKWAEEDEFFLEHLKEDMIENDQKRRQRKSRTT